MEEAINACRILVGRDRLENLNVDRSNGLGGGQARHLPFKSEFKREGNTQILVPKIKIKKICVECSHAINKTVLRVLNVKESL
jgi:hypothetical protein